MIGEGLNHLWQSTVFAVATGLLTIAFRHNRAHVRYWLWFAASVKFFVPFALLINLGGLWPWQAAQWLAQEEIAVAIAQISQPFADTWPSVSSAPSTPDLPSWLGLTILGVWAGGFGSIALIRLQMWRRIRAVVRASAPFRVLGAESSARIQVRSAPGLLEPGVVGWLRPILLLPAGLEEHLTPPQLDAVLAHELCHVRRRDNFTAGIHMVTEAVFWFHPVVWWIGARLVDERELACDEEVIRLGSNPRVYAEGILKTCELYVESPLACVTGVTGSDLTKRIEAIMRNQAGKAVSFRKKLVLCTAIVLAVASPVGVGVLSAPRVHAQSPPTNASGGPALELPSSGLQVDATHFCCPDYLVQMTDRIRVNWVRQSEVDGSNVVKFTIQRDGHIVDVVLEKSSGFQDLDERSQRAVSATNLYALPADFPNPTLTVHLNFAYQR